MTSQASSENPGKAPEDKDDPYLTITYECSNCDGKEYLELLEDLKARDDKTYPAGSIVCAKCKTPTMIKVYRWTKYKK